MAAFRGRHPMGCVMDRNQCTGSGGSSPLQSTQVTEQKGNTAMLRKVPINSVCPQAEDRSHKWVTRDGKNVATGKDKRYTWCDLCGAVPK